MRISTVETEVPIVQNVRVTDYTLCVDLSDGRTISAPLAWYPRVLHGTNKERRNWRVIGKGYEIHWKDLDEDISVENPLPGQASSKSRTSFEKWLSSRPAQHTNGSKGRR